MPVQIGRRVGPPHRTSFAEMPLGHVNRSVRRLFGVRIVVSTILRYRTTRTHKVMHEAIPVRVGQIGICLAP